MIPQEQIDKARKTNLVQYLLNQGIQLKKENNYYRSLEHNSLVFQYNMYHWNSKNEHGSGVEYLTKYMGYSFREAIKELLNVEIVDTNEAKKFNIKDLELTTDIKRSIAYLSKTRLLKMDIIQYLIDKKLISQTNKNNNVAFLIRDENKSVVGAELNTTLSNRRFKGIAPNSKYGYGFTICITNKPLNALYFESVIDLLSFIQHIGYDKFIVKLETCIFVSLAGLKNNILQHTQEVYNNPNIVLCTDNPIIDKASKTFIDNIKKTHTNVKTYTPNDVKDWNELIRKGG